MGTWIFLIIIVAFFLLRMKSGGMGCCGGGHGHGHGGDNAPDQAPRPTEPLAGRGSDKTPQRRFPA